MGRGRLGWMGADDEETAAGNEAEDDGRWGEAGQ